VKLSINEAVLNEYCYFYNFYEFIELQKEVKIRRDFDSEFWNIIADWGRSTDSVNKNQDIWELKT
jgi:hypothetical protein